MLAKEQVSCSLRGLGQLHAVRELYVRKALEAENDVRKQEDRL